MINAVRTTQDIVNAAVQTEVQNAVDQIMYGTTFRRAWRPLGYADDLEQFGAFGYADPGSASRNPLYTKAPPPAPPSAQGILTSVWASGTVAETRQSGFFNSGNIGSETRSYGGLAGMDFVKSQLLFTNDFLLIGLLGGQTDTLSSTVTGTTTKVKAPTVGTYAAYIIGGFATDFAFTTSFIGADAKGRWGLQGPPASINVTKVREMKPQGIGFLAFAARRASAASFISARRASSISARRASSAALASAARRASAAALASAARRASAAALASAARRASWAALASAARPASSAWRGRGG
jgi:hypothetical protein